jgi:hypothetical protein
MNLIVHRAFYGPLLLSGPAPAPVEDAPPLPTLPPVPFDSMSDYARDLAHRANERARYTVTGYVLTEPTRGSKCVIDGRGAAWLPADEAKKLLQWKRPKQDAPPEWVDAAPPDDVDDGERALQVMANRLGIPFNSLIPHNTGFFVPGIPNAYASAGEAIEALFERIYTAPDATVYRPGKPGRAAGIIVTGNFVCEGDVFAAPPAPEVTTVPLTSTQQAAVERAIRPKTAPIDTAQAALF